MLSAQTLRGLWRDEGTRSTGNALAECEGNANVAMASYCKSQMSRSGEVPQIAFRQPDTKRMTCKIVGKWHKASG
jgi:hypothetical protein